ncbi:unnamed protein product, partial [Tenebrio molitor]
MSIMNSFVNDIFERIAAEASVWHTTTNVRRSLAEKFKLPCVCCCPVSWPSTPSPKVPKPSPSTPVR